MRAGAARLDLAVQTHGSRLLVGLMTSNEYAGVRVEGAQGVVVAGIGGQRFYHFSEGGLSGIIDDGIHGAVGIWRIGGQKVKAVALGDVGHCVGLGAEGS